MLSRIAALEKENVELHEEILHLKKEIMYIKTSGSHVPSRPSTPTMDGQQVLLTLEALKLQVLASVKELGRYRVPKDASPVGRRMSVSVPPVGRRDIKKDSFDLDDLLS
jgi:hypothetical protein